MSLLFLFAIGRRTRTHAREARESGGGRGRRGGCVEESPCPKPVRRSPAASSGDPPPFSLSLSLSRVSFFSLSRASLCLSLALTDK